MPYKAEKIKIEGTLFDKRRKLSEDDKKAIQILTNQGYSQRKLAVMFHVSRRLIQSILSPETKAPPKKYSKEYWAEVKKKYRQRKQELFIDGKIGFKKNKNKTSEKQEKRD